MAPIVTDTLRLDSAAINTWRQNEDFDYDRELMRPTKNILEWLWEGFNDLMKKLLPHDMPEGTETAIDVFCVLVLIGLLAWFIIKLKPRLFAHKDDVDRSFTLEDDNIYGIDFDRLIAEAESQHNYRQVVRLVYLQTLRRLADAGRINWQPYKTPMQYTKEFSAAPFWQMTQHFLLIRYGNGEANADMASEMVQKQQAIIRQLEAEAGNTPSPEPQNSRPAAAPAAVSDASPSDQQPPQPQKGGEA